jgi:hypothetical protein
MTKVAWWLMALVPLAASAQETVTVNGPASCSTCVLTLKAEAALGAREGPGSFSGGPRAVVRDSRGMTYVLDFRERASVFVFDERGGFVKRLGREGQGPGELSRVAAMTVGPGDSLHVLDVGNQRRNVFSPAGDWVRSDNWSMRPDQAQDLGNGLIALNGMDPVDPRSPAVVQIYGLDGSRKAAVGFDPRYDQSDVRMLMQPAFRDRVLGASTTGLWVGRRNRFGIEEWTVSGELLRTAERKAGFFPEGLDWWEAVTPERAPMPRLEGMRSRGDGLVWVIALVAAADWRAGIGEEVKRGDQTYYEVDADLLYDSVIELWDLTQGRLVLSQRLPTNIQGFLGPDLVWSIRRDLFAIPYIAIWALELRGLPEQRRF